MLQFAVKIIVIAAIAAASGKGASGLPVQKISAMQIGTCPVVVHPGTFGIPPSGGQVALSITAAPDCTWLIASSATWLAAETAIGSGSALVNVTATPNPGTSRPAFLFVNGLAISVTQAGAGATVCSFEIAPSSLLTPPVGQAGAIGVLAGEPNCPWAAKSHAAWIQVFPISGSGSGTLEYTVYPNFSATDRTGVVNIAGRLFNVSQLGATASLQERFVAMMYYNFFGRLPSTAELFQQVTALSAGLSRTDLAMSFFNSPEFNLGGRFIAGLYVGVLNRDAEFGGWLFQRNTLATGKANQHQLVQNFVNSQEFGLRFGSPTSDEFVRIMYRNILLREPSNGEVAFQVAALNSGLTRVQMAENFLNSAEFRTGTAPRLTAFLIYAVLLGRSATAAELTFRSDQLRSGVPVRTLVEQFLNVPEFLAQLQ
jgi:hypothetical protein